ncbi:MAG: response regulator transcription factor [Acidobacteriota bacterium]
MNAEETHAALTEREAASAGLTKIVIIEDRREIREGLRILLDGTPGYRCVAAFRSMEDAIPAIDGLRPDVALVDIGLPGMSGIEGIRHLKESYAALLLIMLTVYEDDDRIFDAICAGAHGYLLKKTPPARLLESIQEVRAGGSPMSPEVARRVLTMFRDGPLRSSNEYGLTPHEIRVLQMLASGHNRKTAARALDVSVHAVSFHLRSIYDKLHVSSKSAAIAKAIREKIVR